MTVRGAQTDGFDLRVIRTTVLESTVETLRSAILVGHFRPGERLIEADLCATIGISRASLREALRRLEAERLVDIIPNRGPIIPVLGWDEAEQIFHVRRMLESEAAALAARHGTPEDHARMQAALAEFRAAVRTGDLAELIRTTSAFYDAILTAGGNQIIRELLRGLNARISFLRGRSMSMNNRASHSAEELAAIAGAIASGDEAAARASVLSHIDAARAAVQLAYSEITGAASD